VIAENLETVKGIQRVWEGFEDQALHRGTPWILIVQEEGSIVTSSAATGGIRRSNGAHVGRKSLCFSLPVGAHG
jgi:hypothetical protein